MPDVPGEVFTSAKDHPALAVAPALEGLGWDGAVALDAAGGGIGGVCEGGGRGGRGRGLERDGCGCHVDVGVGGGGVGGGGGSGGGRGRGRGRALVAVDDGDGREGVGAHLERVEESPRAINNECLTVPLSIKVHHFMRRPNSPFPYLDDPFFRPRHATPISGPEFENIRPATCWLSTSLLSSRSIPVSGRGRARQRACKAFTFTDHSRLCFQRDIRTTTPAPPEKQRPSSLSPSTCLVSPALIVGSR